MTKKVLCVFLAVVMIFGTLAVTSFAAVDYKDLVDRTFLSGRLKNDMSAVPAVADDDAILKENLLYWDDEVQTAYNSAKTNEDFKALYELMSTPVTLDDVTFEDTWYAHRDESYGKVSIRYVADKLNAEIGERITVNAYLTTNFYTPNAAIGIEYDKNLVEIETISQNAAAFSGWTLVAKNLNYGYLANGTDARAALWPNSMKNADAYANKGLAQIYLISNSINPNGNYARKFNDELVFSATFIVKSGATDGAAITFNAPEDGDWASKDIFDYYDNSSSLFGFERVTENCYPYKAVDEMTFCDHVYTVSGDAVSVGSIAYADYTAYNEEIAKYNKLLPKAADYTVDSWTAYKTAATVEIDKNLTVDDQRIVSSATNAIIEAYNKLRVKGVSDAYVIGMPKLNANANIGLVVAGSPTIIRLVDSKDRSNTITIFREDAKITADNGYETWLAAVYTYETKTTYKVYAKYSDGYNMNCKDLVVVSGIEDDLTIHSMYISDMVGDDGVTPLGNNGRVTYGVHKITFTTSTAVLKIQLIDGDGNTWTYSAADTSLFRDKDGERTWVVSLNFCFVGNWTLGIRTRSMTTTFARCEGIDLHATVL